jgi:hypothetical protein
MYESHFTRSHKRARIEIIPADRHRVLPASQFHDERAEFFPLASSGGVAAELVRIVSSSAVLLAICWHFSLKRSCLLEKSLNSSGLKIGSSGRIRTYDQSVNSRPLYH